MNKGINEASMNEQIREIAQVHNRVVYSAAGASTRIQLYTNMCNVNRHSTSFFKHHYKQGGLFCRRREHSRFGHLTISNRRQCEVTRFKIRNRKIKPFRILAHRAAFYVTFCCLFPSVVGHTR